VGALGKSSPVSGSKENPLMCCASPKLSSAALTKCFALADAVSGQAAICGSEEISLLAIQC